METFLKNKVMSLERQLAAAEGDAGVKLAEAEAALSAARAQELTLRSDMEEAKRGLEDVKSELAAARAGNAWHTLLATSSNAFVSLVQGCSMTWRNISGRPWV